MKEIDISEVSNIIKACPNNINLMFIGDSGIGKTTVVEEYCKKNNIFLKTLILSQLDASEVLGVPTVISKTFNEKEYKCMDEAIPLWVFELAEHKDAILFLDEFLCADPAIMNSFLNLLSQKRVKDIDLSHVKFIAATNIGRYTYDPDFNILTRFCFFYVINNSFKLNLPFNYNYEDPFEKEGEIFEGRRLVPRCAESLKSVPKEYLEYFYEGFTNTNMEVVKEYSVGLKISRDVTILVSNFVSNDESSGFKDYVKEELEISLFDFLFKKYKRVYKNVIKSLTILTKDQVEKGLEYTPKK